MKAAELLFKLKDLTNALFTINSTVETEVAELIAVEKGVELDIQRQRTAEEELDRSSTRRRPATRASSKPRAPIVTIMGHVDHGKTSLLDKIRKTYGIESNVVATEAGGITQVIRAWRVEHDGQPITFLDTPGHEAFTKMRARGANVTDIAVIVVAADDGVMPQTEEADQPRQGRRRLDRRRHQQDRPARRQPRPRREQQLYSLELLPDNMGGDVPFVETSAVTGKGIDELLDTLSLVAELKELKANPNKPAQGTCLEANLSERRGRAWPRCWCAGHAARGRRRSSAAPPTAASAPCTTTWAGRSRRPGPSVPVRITGLDEVPNADDPFHVVAELAKAREIAEKPQAEAAGSRAGRGSAR